jgi:hypothetical protein
MTLQFVYIAFWEYTRETGEEITMKTEVKIEPLAGQKREERALLDFCSWTVFSLDFAKAHFGKEGPASLGRHWGSLEKLGWKSLQKQELAPSEFLRKTYELNWEPMGFKAVIYEDVENAAAEFVVEVNPLADFINKYMAEVSTLKEEDGWEFFIACFEWVKEYGYKFEAQKNAKGYSLTITHPQLKKTAT